MISDRKLAANRRNAQRSTGPRTAAGLARSSQNAVRHGLDARSPIIPALEDPAAWDAHLASTLLGLGPVGPLETTLAERAALLLWRLGRVARYERTVTALGHRRVAQTAAGAELIPPATGAASARNRLRALSDFKRLAPEDRVTAGQASCIVAAVADVLRPGDRDGDVDHVINSFMANEANRQEGRHGWTTALVRRLVDALAASRRRKPAGVLADALVAAQRAAPAERAAARRVRRRAEQLRREGILLAADKLDVVIRYETHLTRQLDLTLAQLRQLQQARPAAEPDPHAATAPHVTPDPPASSGPTPIPPEPDSPPRARSRRAVSRKRTQPPPGQPDPGTTESHPATSESHPATAESHPATIPVRSPTAQNASGTPPAPPSPAHPVPTPPPLACP